ncbi:hypothetical protein [Glycomyces harbinensis]|uniref:Uncharacterized protein n=1 Tax=Glycomyces harbinensis TaxID=58114 RepID=A0A1G6YVJ5_9ACTN|nr:hypothetical protein [Glycomyces harbinensis]SDD94073.1 hypothetical protein SAMN05216270_109183 [Glycomyces harbinensis]
MTLTVAAIALGLAAALVYAFRCWAFPFARCWWCKADGRNAAGYCNACHGTGRRVRLGRHVYDLIRAEYRRGTK